MLTAPAQQTGGTAYTVDEDSTNDTLHQVNLDSGATVNIGVLNNPDDIEALAFSPGGTLFAANEANVLMTIDLSTGSSTTIGVFGPVFDYGGLAFDCNGNLWMTSHT